MQGRSGGQMARRSVCCLLQQAGTRRGVTHRPTMYQCSLSNLRQYNIGCNHALWLWPCFLQAGGSPTGPPVLSNLRQYNIGCNHALWLWPCFLQGGGLHTGPPVLSSNLRQYNNYIGCNHTLWLWPCFLQAGGSPVAYASIQVAIIHCGCGLASFRPGGTRRHRQSRTQ